MNKLSYQVGYHPSPDILIIAHQLQFVNTFLKKDCLFFNNARANEPLQRGSPLLLKNKGQLLDGSRALIGRKVFQGTTGGV